MTWELSPSAIRFRQPFVTAIRTPSKAARASLTSTRGWLVDRATRHHKQRPSEFRVTNAIWYQSFSIKPTLKFILTWVEGGGTHSELESELHGGLGSRTFWNATKKWSAHSIRTVSTFSKTPCTTWLRTHHVCQQTTHANMKQSESSLPRRKRNHSEKLVWSSGSEIPKDGACILA